MRQPANLEYNFTKPVSTPQMFKGRAEETRDIMEAMRRCDSYAIVGGRRSGKTSLLFQLERLLREDPEPDKPHGLLLSGLEFSDLSQAGFYRKVIEKLKASPVPGATEISLKRGDLESDPSRVIQEVLGELISSNQPESRFIIMIDEVDVLQHLDWSPVLFGNLRHLIAESRLNSHVGMVIAGTLGIAELYSFPGSPLLGALLGTICLKPLSRQETLDLIQMPTDYQIPQEVVDYLEKQSGGHPFLVQYLMTYLCRRHRADLGRARHEDIDRIIERFGRERKDFHNWVDNFTPEAVVVYRYLAEVGGAVKKAEIVRAMGNGTEASKVFEMLSHFGVIRETSESLVIGSEMFKTWFEENLPRQTERPVGFFP